MASNGFDTRQFQVCHSCWDFIASSILPAFYIQYPGSKNQCGHGFRSWNTPPTEVIANGASSMALRARRLQQCLHVDIIGRLVVDPCYGLLWRRIQCISCFVRRRLSSISKLTSRGMDVSLSPSAASSRTLSSMSSRTLAHPTVTSHTDGLLSHTDPSLHPTKHGIGPFSLLIFFFSLSIALLHVNAEGHLPVGLMQVVCTVFHTADA